MTEKRKFKLRIDETNYEIDKSAITGTELLELAGKSVEDHFVTMIVEGADDQIIDDDEIVDLGEPGRERFTVVAKEGHHWYIDITIDSKSYIVHKHKMLGSDLRALPEPDVSEDRDLWLDVAHCDDLLIEPTALVKMRKDMVFFTAPKTINPGELN